MERTAITDREELKKITETLLSPGPDYSAIRNACYALHELFCNAAGLDIFTLAEDENQEHITTTAGLAVSPYAAAFCITDMMRTKKFLQGIKEAVEFKLKHNPERPVVVFYAGCGPFATLLIPLTTVFSPAQLQMVLMDINSQSIQYLKKIIQHFSAEDYVSGIVEADAIHYVIPREYQPDILLSETMKPALAKEPQVSVISQLLRQCGDKVILIPEKITVEACLLGNISNNPDAIQTLQKLLEFDAAIALQINDKPQRVIALSKGVVVNLDEMPAGHLTKLTLNTAIKIYGNQKLGYNESGLTIPVHVMDIASIKKYPARLLFQYQVSANPGFTVKEL